MIHLRFQLLTVAINICYLCSDEILMFKGFQVEKQYEGCKYTRRYKTPLMAGAR